MKPLVRRSRVNWLLTRPGIMTIKPFHCHENHRYEREKVAFRGRYWIDRKSQLEKGELESSPFAVTQIFRVSHLPDVDFKVPFAQRSVAMASSSSISMKVEEARRHLRRVKFTRLNARSPKGSTSYAAGAVASSSFSSTIGDNDRENREERSNRKERKKRPSPRRSGEMQIPE